MMNHVPKKRAVSDAERIKSLKDTNEANLPAMVELFLQDAKLQRAKFEAYLGEGFTPEQAMQLCTRP